MEWHYLDCEYCGREFMGILPDSMYCSGFCKAMSDLELHHFRQVQQQKLKGTFQERPPAKGWCWACQIDHCDMFSYKYWDHPNDASVAYDEHLRKVHGLPAR